MKPDALRPNKGVKGFWLRETPDPEALSEDAGQNWVKVKGFDIAGEGDVKFLGGYEKTHSIDELKGIVIENGWSGFTLANGNCYFKKTVYHLKAKFLRRSTPNHVIYISPYHNVDEVPSPLGTW